MLPEGLLATLAAAAFALAVLALLLVLLLGLRLRTLSRRCRLPSVGNADLDRLLSDELERIEKLGSELGEVAQHVARLDAEGRRAVARVGVVRFNPFEDTGGNQSFALALLDSRADGIVLSSLHSRQQTRIYLKSVRAGAAETALSDEEAEALRRAATGGGASEA